MYFARGVCLNYNEIDKLIELAKKYKIKDISCLVITPEENREERIQLALLLCEPDYDITNFLSETRRSSNEEMFIYKLISKYRLVTAGDYYREILQLKRALESLQNEEGLIRLLPLINKYTDNNRGTFVMFIEPHVYQAPSEQVEAVVNYVYQSAPATHTAVQLAQLVNYLLEEDNFQKILNKEADAIDKLAALLANI